MPKEFEDQNLSLRAWTLLHRTSELFLKCEDGVVGEFGLTTEQYRVLIAMKCLDDPVRPTDVGRWVDHKVNTVSMIVDRMVKAGLIERIRDLPDRREVRLVITPKGEHAFKPATPAVWRLIEELTSSLSYEDKRTVIRLLETLRDKALQHLSPAADIRETASYETAQVSHLMKRMGRYTKSKHERMLRV